VRSYKEIREGNPRKLRIVNGEVVLGRLPGLLAVSPLKRLQHSLMLVMIVMALLGLNLVAPHVVPTALSSWLAVLAGLGVALSAHASMTLQRKIRQPLKNATELARIMAGGDLTQAVVASGSDEFGQLQGALWQMNINLRSIIGDVRSDFENLKRSTQEISTGNKDLAKRTESQAASLEEISASMTMLTAAVQQSAVNAAYADELAHGAGLIVQQSGQIVGQMMTTMQDVTTASHQIVDIISLIDGIAFQTNILALNAAVEAARAGELGRGFAVVAAEVRSLAARSASAAKDIKQLIATTVSQVDTGMKLSCEAGNSMHQAIESVEKVTQIMTDITQATCTQGANIGHISEAVRHLDDVTRKNLALVKDAAVATTDLSEQTERLACAIVIFKTSGDEAGTAAPAKLPLA
jgi:aerotaxis receptor